MNIVEFNQKFENQFRLKEYPKVTDNFRYFLEEWCPNLNAWNRKIPASGAFVYKEVAQDSEREVSKHVFDYLSLPCVIIHKGHHGNSYYSGKNTEEIGLALLYLLNQLIEDEYFLYEPKKPKSPIHKPEEFEDDYELKLIVQRQQDKYKRDFDIYQEGLRLKKDAFRAVEQKNINLAYEVLGQISEIELENLTIITVDKLKDFTKEN